MRILTMGRMFYRMGESSFHIYIVYKDSLIFFSLVENNGHDLIFIGIYSYPLCFDSQRDGGLQPTNSFDLGTYG